MFSPANDFVLEIFQSIATSRGGHKQPFVMRLCGLVGSLFIIQKSEKY